MVWLFAAVSSLPSPVKVQRLSTELPSRPTSSVGGAVASAGCTPASAVTGPPPPSKLVSFVGTRTVSVMAYTQMPPRAATASSPEHTKLRASTRPGRLSQVGLAPLASSTSTMATMNAEATATRVGSRWSGHHSCRWASRPRSQRWLGTGASAGLSCGVSMSQTTRFPFPPMALTRSRNESIPSSPVTFTREVGALTSRGWSLTSPLSCVFCAVLRLMARSDPLRTA
mmetsp:Transcript_14886/g.44848  ORF Transcript_14886/g.44848 Transcript_14886/m.44848 type:complete len:227 (-) Transcript_14886:351-1031(-)